MALIVTPGAPDANSYATLAEADAYLAICGYDLDTWSDLDDAHKEFRLKTAALLMNTLPFRGEKACRDQRLEFPRWWRTDDGYPPYEDTYLTMEDIDDTGHDRPTISDDIKEAQIELAYHVVHKGILETDFLDDPDRVIKSFMLGGSLAVEFSDRTSADSSLLDKSRLRALDVAYFKLFKWIKRVSGGIA